MQTLIKKFSIIGIYLSCLYVSSEKAHASRILEYQEQILNFMDFSIADVQDTYDYYKSSGNQEALQELLGTEGKFNPANQIKAMVDKAAQEVRGAMHVGEPTAQELKELEQAIAEIKQLVTAPRPALAEFKQLSSWKRSLFNDRHRLERIEQEIQSATKVTKTAAVAEATEVAANTTKTAEAAANTTKVVEAAPAPGLLKSPAMKIAKNGMLRRLITRLAKVPGVKLVMRRAGTIAMIGMGLFAYEAYADCVDRGNSQIACFKEVGQSEASDFFVGAVANQDALIGILSAELRHNCGLSIRRGPKRTTMVIQTTFSDEELLSFMRKNYTFEGILRQEVNACKGKPDYQRMLSLIDKFDAPGKYQAPSIDEDYVNAFITELKKDQGLHISKSGYINSDGIVWMVSNRTTMAWMKQDALFASAIAGYCMNGKNDQVRDKLCDWHSQFDI